ncbi:hypothetical protein C8J55DRAFT_151827 [Lentinula edodes]|uniref:Uncharacterized protein n=1 Tax=Lentinula lateritia TaxID=40482 RepID=A0A9W9A1W7_9AGAR|nr:hypothetical protein C8J55DRAFT_151827 [Lentinula edodes]
MTGSEHAFFTLPLELHIHIFTLACTPNSTKECTAGPSYYTAFYTGIALSLVCKYVRAASAPVRHRAVVIYGWREMLAFERILSNSQTRSRVRYLTLVADELPQDPISLLSEGSYATGSSSALSPPSTSQFCYKTGLERKLLEVVARILRGVGNDLYELEIGFQAIENIKDPLAYLSLTGPGPHSPLFFPCLDTMFYACPPSNAFPWGMSSKPTPVINTIFTGSESTTFIPVSPNLTCPRLKELTVVCNDSTSTLQSEILDDQFPEYIPEEGAEEDTELREPSTTEETRNSVEASAGLLDAEMNTNKFPSLSRLTLFASTPAQALAAIDVEEAAWDVGSDFQIDICGLRRNITSTAGPENPFETEGGTQSEEFHTVVLRPKARWNERWESLRDVARRQREAKVEEGKSDDDVKTLTQETTQFLSYTIYVPNFWNFFSYHSVTKQCSENYFAHAIY